MEKLLIVGTGGFIGAVARYASVSMISKFVSSSFPLGTLMVNVVGCFCMGLIMELGISSSAVSNEWKLFLTTGVMGGLTTFSAFGFETMDLFAKGKFWIAILNVLFSIFTCFCSVWLGRYVVLRYMI